MAGTVLQQLPNSLTFLRLLLAAPLGLCILREAYVMALLVGLAAGITDALDGLLARKLQAVSRVGAILDPIADKTLITVCFVCFAAVGLLPWYIAAIVITRDVVIVAGAISYRLLIGPFEFAATTLSKANMFVQILFCLLVLVAQVVPEVPAWSVTAGTLLVIFFAAASGSDYVLNWTIRALQASKRTRQTSQRPD
ncbi:MAG: CDP-alcohol phosphatidyltransferase family protein [Halioglobus sp.]